MSKQSNKFSIQVCRTLVIVYISVKQSSSFGLRPSSWYITDYDVSEAQPGFENGVLHYKLTRRNIPKERYCFSTFPIIRSVNSYLFFIIVERAFLPLCGRKLLFKYSLVFKRLSILLNRLKAYCSCLSFGRIYDRVQKSESLHM